MTTATNPGNYVDFDEYVGLKLEKTRSTIRTTDVLTALAGVAAMFLGYLLIFVVLDQWVVRGGFGVAWRWVLLSTLMTATIAWLVWKIGVPSFRVINGLFAAQEIEKAEPGLKSNLLNLIDLKATGRAINPSIRMAMERQAAIRLQHIDVSHAIDHRPLVRTAYILLAVIVIFCFYALLSPKKISNSIWRGLLPAAEVPLATVTEILDVKPGDLTVQAHQPFVDVQVDLAGEIPAQVLLLYSTADGKQDQPIELRPDQQGETRFKGQLIGEGVQGLMYDVTYYIRAGDATSRHYKITVEQPPYAEIESVRIEFPSYMKLQSIEQPNNGGIDAWEGAKVLLSAKTNMPVRSAMIQFLDDPQAGPTGEEIPMSVTGSGQHLQAHWTLALRSDGTFPKYYRIHCRTEDGRVTTGHVMNPLTIRPDLPPEIVLMHPERDLDAPANAIIALLAQARDPDFELGYLYLNVEKAGQKIVHEVLSEGRQPRLTIKHDLSLAKLNAAVGDVFEIWIEAYDNKQPRPNTKNTPKVKIRVQEAVSQKQAQDQLAEQKERVDQKLAEADQESNQDQTDAARPRDGDPRERQAQNGARPEDADQNLPANPQEDKPQEGDQGQKQKNQQRAPGNKNQSGDPKSGSGSNGAQKSDADKNQNDSSRDPSDRGAKSEKPLPSDGSQDDAVLQRLNELINKNNQPKPGESDNRPSAENPQPSTGEAQSEPKTQSPKDISETGTGRDEEKPQPKSDRKQSDSTEVGKPGVKDPKQKPGSNEDLKTPEESSSDPRPDSASKDENRANQKTSKNEMKEENGPDGNRPKTATKKSNEEKSDEEKKDKGTQADPTQPPDRKQKDQTSEKRSANPDKNSTETPDRKKRSDPKPGEQTGERKEGDGKADGSKPDSKQTDNPSDSPSKPSTVNKPDPSKNENGTRQNPSGKSEQKDERESPAKTSDQPENQDSKADSPSNKDLPTGLNKNSPKQSTTEKGTAGKPKNETTNPASKADGQREPAPDSPDAKKESTDGTEKGVGKPDRDPNAKPSSTKNENVKRDPKEIPETRPGQTPQDPSDGKPDGKTQPKTDDGKSKAVPRNDDSKDPQSPDSNDKSQDSADDKQDGSKSGEAGKPRDKSRKSDQNSNDAASQKTRDQGDASGTKKGAGSKDDGKSESDADSSSKPDSGESGSKQSSSSQKSGQGEKQSGSSKEKNSADQPSNDKKPTGSKSKDDQSGRGKKDDKSSEAASEKSDQGESGKSDSDKSESGGGKGDGSEKGQGQGGKPGGKAGQKLSNQPAGPNTNGGHGGESSGGVAEATKGGEVAPTEQSDDANLEYNKQATELILQKLKKDLDRGDFDPELLEQLGWTKTEMKQFADRLSKSLSESKLADETAEGKARQQQFQEMLKNLNLQKSAAQRSGTKEPKRDVDQVESKRSPPPPVYRSAYEKWTRDLARQKPSTSDKPAKKE